MWPTWKNVVIISDQTPFIQFKGRWGLIGGGPYGPADKPIWESYPTDDKGNLTREKPHTVLKEIDNINLSSNKPQYFDMDISTHYFKVCWVLEKKVGSEFQLFNGNISGKIEALEENKKIVMAWRLKTWPAGNFILLSAHAFCQTLHVLMCD